MMTLAATMSIFLAAVAQLVLLLLAAPLVTGAGRLAALISCGFSGARIWRRPNGQFVGSRSPMVRVRGEPGTGAWAALVRPLHGGELGRRLR